jgi:protein-S-isoprenylcysteine O-methyltransferase Ste14
LTRSLIAALITVGATVAIRFVYWTQYRVDERKRRSLLVATHALAVSAIIVSYWWVCWHDHRPGLAPFPLTALGWLAFGGGSLLFWWSVFVHATSLVPSEAATLTVAGPYRLLRHPIYSGGLLGALGLLAVVPTFPVLLDWLVLLACMVALARSEERELLRRLPGYREYMTATMGILPLRWRQR